MAKTTASLRATPERQVATESPRGGAAMLTALQRLSELLTDEVVPRLSGADAAEDVTSPEEDARARVFARTAPQAIRKQPGVRIGPTGRVLLRVLEHYPKKGGIYITSAYRPEEPTSHHGGLSYKGSPTAALDIGAGGVTPEGSRRMRDVAKWLYNRFAADTVELIHTTPFANDNGFYVKNQRRYPGGGPYGPSTRAQHRNHVHFATSKALAQKILAGLRKPKAFAAPARAPAAAPVWGWDASGHDWKRGPMNFNAARKAGISFFTHKCTEGSTFKTRQYQQGLRRARAAGIPVLGAYHVLWPGKPLEQARVFFNEVNQKTPWWKQVPWIWQLDAEKFDSMPRAPTPAESKKFFDELRRLAGGKGWFVAYAPRWLYHDRFRIGCDLWASDYGGSGAPRPFKQQYKGVPASSWQAYSGRKPRVLQFASDAVIGTQHTCDANRFDGNLEALVALTRHRPAQIRVTAARQSVLRAAAAGYPHRSCRPGGPMPADKAAAAKIGRKLRGKLSGAFDGDRLCCARRIVAAVKARGLHRRAAVIAVTTAIVESTLLNINRELDHDSLGLFQQRASWGSRAQRLNPTWATNAFINAMLRKYPRKSWMPLPIGRVCQSVQVSAYPERYQHEVADARAIVFALWRAAKRQRPTKRAASFALAESVRKLLTVVRRHPSANTAAHRNASRINAKHRHQIVDLESTS